MALRKDLKLASFDASKGGCIFQLETMRDLMCHIKTKEYLNQPEKVVLPCEYFDLMGGSGLGGVVAIFLAKLQMSADEAIIELSSMLKALYPEKETTPGERAPNVRRFIEDLLKRRGDPMDSKLETNEEGQCGALILTGSRGGPGASLSLRTYQVESQPASGITVVDAVLEACSSEHSITSSNVHSAPQVINPVRNVIWEALLRCGGDSSVACLMSVGSAHPLGDEMAQQIQKMIGRTGIYSRFDSTTPAKTEELATNLAKKEGSITLDELNTLCLVKDMQKTPSDSSPHFLADEILLEKLRVAMSGNVSGRSVIVFTGKSDCGKSQFVQDLESSCATLPKHIFWVNARSEASIRSDILRQVGNASPVDEPSKYDDAMEFFRENSSWLIIYNNANDTKLSFSSFFPKGDLGTIFVTSSNDAFGLLASESHLHLKLDVMSETEAVQLIIDSAQQVSSSENMPVLAAMAKELGHLPISLAQAGHYMRETGCASTEYQLLLLQHSPEREPASQVFAISYEKIPHTTQILLQLFSVLGASNFPLAAIPFAAKQRFRHEPFPFIERSPDCETAIQLLESIFLPEGIWSDQALSKMTSTLQAYSLASFTTTLETELISVHPLLQVWLLDQMPMEKRAVLRDAASCLLACVTEKTWLEQHLPAHIDALMQIGDLPPIHLNQRAAFGKILWNMNLREDAQVIWKAVYAAVKIEYGAVHLHVATAAIELAATHDAQTLQTEQFKTEAVSIRETLIGSHHVDTLRAKQELASSFEQQNRLDEAIKLKEQILQDLKSQHPVHHPDILNAILMLSYAYVLEICHKPQGYSDYTRDSDLLSELLEGQISHYGRAHLKVHDTMQYLATISRVQTLYPITEELLKELLELAQRGRSEADILLCRVELAEVYIEQRKYTQAAPHLMQSVDALRAELGEFHRRTSGALCSLADVYHHLGRPLEANSLLEGALKARRGVFGETHPSTIKPMKQLAILYFKQGRYSDAEALQLEALYIQRNYQTQDKSNTLELDIAFDLVDTYFAWKKYAEAVELQLKLLGKTEERFGRDFPLTIELIGGISRAYVLQGQFHEAERFQIEDLERRKALPGPPDPLIFTVMNNLASTYRSLGRISEAETMQLKVIAEWRALAHQDTPDALRNLAEMYRLQKRHEEASAIREEVFDWFKRSGDADKETVLAMAALALSYEADGRPTLATPLLTSLIDILKTKRRAKPRDIFIYMSLLGRNYSTQGRHADAIPIYVEALKGLSASSGEADPCTLAAMQNLAVAYFQRGRYQDALPLQLHALALKTKAFGSESVDVAKCSRDLAAIYYKMDCLDEAGKLAMESAQVFWRLEGQKSSEYQTTITLLEAIKQPTFSSALKWIKRSCF